MATRFNAGGVLSYFTRHATVANLLFVLLIVAGSMALPNMRAQFFPDVVVDDIRVSVTWSGAGAEDVDAGIVQVLEPTLLSVDGVEESSSRAREGSASIRLEFEPGWDMSQALDDVTTAVNGVNTLPDAAEDPRITRGGWRDRVTDVVITGPVGIDQLARFSDEMVARLFQEGVTRTSINGVVAPQTVVEVRTADLVRYDVTMPEIAQAIASEADASPAGSVASGAARVRAGVEKRSAEDISGIVLRSELDGSKLTIGDVAEIRVEGVDRARTFFVGENPAVTVSVVRNAAGDAIGIQRTVEEVAAEMMTTLPEGVSIDLIRTRAELITGRLNILMENGAMGLVLVLITLFLFLNARTALWVAAGIPVSMLAAIAIMYALGLTINMISLFALIITLGIVVDDAIVVGEHADFRARRRGEGPVEAAENAARRMFAPVFSSTLTTIIAFFGLTLIGGRFGDFIADVPFTVIAVLAASLVECFLILPNHMSHALAHAAKEHWYDWPSRQVNKGFRWFRERVFRPIMSLVVTGRYAVFAGAVLLLATQAALFIRGDVPFRFFNAPEQGTVTGNFAMVNGATRADTLDFLSDLQASVDATGAALEEEHGRNPVTYVLAEIGGSSGRGLASAEDKDADLLGSITIELIDADLRPYSSFEFVSIAQDNVPDHPLLEEFTFRGGRFGPGGDALDIELTGADSDTLKSAAEALKTALGEFPEVSALEDSLAYDKEELVLELTPQGQALGFTIDEIGQVLRNRLSGIEAATYPDGMRSAAIRVELPESELSLAFLQRSQLRTDQGNYVNLADLVSITSRTGFASVNRENGLRVVEVTGDMDEGDGERAAEIQRAVEETILPTIAEDWGVEYRFAGLSEQEDRFLSDALLGLIICLIGIYIVLAWIFSSWTRPLVVMAIIPFGLIGAIYGHNAWGVPLSMFSVVGLIGMVGIIINDSIVLVSTVDEYAADRGIRHAVIDATADRLRPVFLTTATTVLGLLPLLFEGSQQAQFLKPTVITLVYGLGFGFILVLLVVPAILAMQEDLRRQMGALRHALAIGRRAPWVARIMSVSVVLLAALFAVTMGWVLVTGALPGGSGSIGLAGGLFLLGSLVISVGAYLAALALRPRSV
ncbi:efflux RND transporter permease subunit [Maritimibacter sp. UBA3975]|uniref:efflux RND transporter permease subunit n=1 Tax=Maritimibacter sp. UBA3975 TaxID=1946833 RepID=UPI000C0923B0|nr:efflux RND transporter permease subunit [Maritimibacter sp. UBA3975]MAM62107.1 acriflavine resistance protein B [Maritimibacter sp.]